jgi:PAS domain-containing protein
MHTLAVQFLEQGLHRALFNAIPIPVLVVDEDVSILEYNQAAAQLLGSDKQTVLYRRGGEVLHCIHAAESLRGCGRGAACADCVVREAVRSAAQGRQTVREWARFELYAHGERKEVALRVSCEPVKYEGRTLILLMLEGMND